MSEHRFSLVQDGVIVAEASSDCRSAALREIMHYAMVYSQDGPCSIQGIAPEDWDQIADKWAQLD